MANPNSQTSLAYATLLDVMKEVGLVAQATVEFKGKEHNVIIRVYNDGTQDVLMLHTIYTSADVRTVNIVRPTVPVSPQLKTLCTELIASMTASFDSSEIVSASDAKFNGLIERKQSRDRWLCNSCCWRCNTDGFHCRRRSGCKTDRFPEHDKESRSCDLRCRGNG